MLAQHLDERHAVGGLVAVPMRPDDEVLGVISMYQVEGGRLEVDLDNAQFLANAIGVAILGRFARSESTEMVWSSRDRVNQATGMVVAQLRITTTDALALLRAHAFAHGVPLAEVAASVVNRDLDFRKTDDGEEGQG
jgi:GAF domain-containing protein